MDLSVDVGEEEGGDDAFALGLLPFVTSVNVACAFHAGDPLTMDRIVRAAAGAGVAVGAHPSYDDREGFGRRERTVPPERLLADLVYQLGALQAFARAHRAPLRHVKPHGALYHRAASDPVTADVVARAVARADPALVLVGPARGLVLPHAAEAHGIRFAAEAFADRRYDALGQLLPRAHPEALVLDPAVAAAQAVQIAALGQVTTADGTPLALRAETIGLHGDTPGAAAIARAVRDGLEAAGIELAPLAP